MNSKNRIEILRLLLEQEQHRDISYAEASEVAESLIQFFEVLADGLQSVNQFAIA